jgi:hypothetical protein
MGMTAPELIQQIEDLGGSLAIDGDRIRVLLTPEAETWVSELQRTRDEVFRVLLERDRPEMPDGVRLLRWDLKRPPVAISEISVITDPQRFAETTLRQLEAAIQRKPWNAGNWSTRDLCERLEQVGVHVRVEGDHDEK